MSFGLEIYDASGGKSLSTADRIGRILGSVTVTAESGSGAITDEALASGAPFYILRTPAAFTGAQMPPTVSFNGTTMSWVSDLVSGSPPVTIFYGVY